MEDSRRSFLKLACTTGICSCAAVLHAGEAAGAAGSQEQQENPMPRRWIAALLPTLAAEADPATAGRILKAAAVAHYEHLRMDERVAPFQGNLDGFLAFLSKEWGWKIEQDRAAGVIMVDEAKSYCVCPLVEKGTQGDLGVLCNCSEGFAERMFSAVVGHPVRAEVTQSVLRGGSTCKYRISLA